MTRAIRRAAIAVLVVPLVVASGEETTAEPPQLCWGMHATCNVRGNLRVARHVEHPPAAVAKLFAGKPFRVYQIDIDSDGRPDFIVQEGAPVSRTCFVDSAARVRSCEPSGGDGFAYYWFAQLDGDPMLELFAMEGDEDSSDYRIQKLDPKTWKRHDLVRIDPILLTDEKDPTSSFWGYPWDVKDLILERRRGRVLLRAAPPGAAAAFGGDDERANVVILFKGTPTQDGPPGGFLAAVKASRFMPLDGVVRLSSEPPALKSKPER
jgi:hypothetical protein